MRHESFGHIVGPAAVRITELEQDSSSVGYRRLNYESVIAHACTQAVERYIAMEAAAKDAQTKYSRPGKRVSAAVKEELFQAYCEAANAFDAYREELGIVR
jgi:hypothetical protein